MRKPTLTLERDNTGRLNIGVTEWDSEGYGTRAYVLSQQNEHTADSVMERRYHDMQRLMQGNIEQALPAPTTGRN